MIVIITCLSSLDCWRSNERRCSSLEYLIKGFLLIGMNISGSVEDGDVGLGGSIK